MRDKIDFVVLWVDDTDKKWKEEKNKYNPKLSVDVADNRYRDWDMLPYWFRGVEKFAQWVNKIFFVTYGHFPKWLNLNHPKLVFVKHTEFIPEKYLPTFSSHPIELNIHRIQNLSEKFVYFNDDMFIVNHMGKDDFFIDGLPADRPAIYPIVARKNYAFPHIILNVMFLINKNFKKEDVIKKNFKKWISPKYNVKENLKNLFFYTLKDNQFPGFSIDHLPAPYLKSTLENAWELFEKELDATSKRKFRDVLDINQYLFRYLQFMYGKFSPINLPKIGKYFSLSNSTELIIEALRDQHYKMVCLNDDSTDLNFAVTKKIVLNEFNKILPEKSSYEL